MTEKRITFITGPPGTPNAWFVAYCLCAGAKPTYYPTTIAPSPMWFDLMTRGPGPHVLIGPDMLVDYPILKDMGNWILLAGRTDLGNAGPTVRENYNQCAADGALVLDVDYDKEIPEEDPLEEVHKVIFGETESFDIISNAVLNLLDIGPDYEALLLKAHGSDTHIMDED
jgi:hypothetical protein